MPKRTFRDMRPTVSRCRRFGLRHRPGTFLFRDLDAGFYARASSKAAPKRNGVVRNFWRHGIALEHQPDGRWLVVLAMNGAAQSIDGDGCLPFVPMLFVIRRRRHQQIVPTLKTDQPIGRMAELAVILRLQP